MHPNIVQHAFISFCKRALQMVVAGIMCQNKIYSMMDFLSKRFFFFWGETKSNKLQKTWLENQTERDTMKDPQQGWKLTPNRGEISEWPLGFLPYWIWPVDLSATNLLDSYLPPFVLCLGRLKGVSQSESEYSVFKSGRMMIWGVRAQVAKPFEHKWHKNRLLTRISHLCSNGSVLLCVLCSNPSNYDTQCVDIRQHVSLSYETPDCYKKAPKGSQCKEFLSRG